MGGFGLGSFDKTLWTIKDLKEETEAYLKGFRCGDKIVSVDDELLTKKTCDKIAEILQFKEKKSITICVEQKSKRSNIVLDVTREGFGLDSLEHLAHWEIKDLAKGTE